jgi:hypothetical protein
VPSCVTTRIAVVACLWLQASLTLAEEAPFRVALLELESDTLHDAFTMRFSERLRAALSARTDLELRDRRATLAQMSLAQDCNATETSCLAAIAETFEVQGLIFGSVTRQAGAPSATVYRFDSSRASLAPATYVMFSAHDAELGELEREASRIVSELFGTPAPAAVAVGSLTQPAAAPVGLAMAAPAVLPPLSELSPPPAAAPSIAPAPAKKAGSGLGGRQIAGIALLGGAALSVGLSVLSFVQVERADRDDDFQRYRRLVGERMNDDVKDVCNEAAAGRRYGLEGGTFHSVQSTCDTGSTFEALQFVFLGTAVVSGGLAAYFLASGGPADKPALGSRTFNVAPSLARRGFGVGARLKF